MSTVILPSDKNQIKKGILPKVAKSPFKCASKAFEILREYYWVKQMN